VSRHLSVDEQMIPFCGTTSLKQHVKNKPNPVGIKNFDLTTPNGLVLDFFTYHGAKTWLDGQPKPNLGIRGSVVKKLVEGRVSNEHAVYSDHYFTSVPLLDSFLKGVSSPLEPFLQAACRELKNKKFPVAKNC
jgi:hypothetical protein